MSVICPNCGRENPDIRLFCSGCGEVLPDPSEKSEPTRPEPSFDEFRPYRAAEESEEKADVPETETPSDGYQAQDASDAEKTSEDVPVDIPDIEDIPDETEFYRRRQRYRKLEEDLWSEQPVAPATESSLFDVQDDPPKPSDSPYARKAQIPAHRPELNRREESDLPTGRANTYIPKRSDTMDPDEFFAVKGQVLPEYPDEPEPSKRRERNRNDEFEEEETGNFAVRHMRGLVAGVLLLMTAAILLVWANTAGAQRLLAQIDLAWRPAAYEQLGMEAYNAKDYSAAGHYFTQALNRDEGNYQYALYAANSYINGEYVSKALTALRRCIELEPAKPDLYLKLVELQAGYDNLSASDQELVKQGYRQTGDERLKYE